MFFGVYTHALDPRRRIYIPRRFRESLSENFLLLLFNDHLCIMNPEEFQEYSKRWEQLDHPHLKRYFFSSTAQCNTDAQGRVSIPPNLAERAYLSGGQDAVFVGMGSHVELYPAARYKELETDYLSDFELSEMRFMDKAHSLPAIRYGDGVVQYTNILLPQKAIAPSKEIISNLIATNHSLLSKIKENETLIEKLTPREFEELVCEILDKSGLSVKLTKRTRDGGKDIIVCENKLIGNFLTYVECKQYRRDRPVSVGLVRELYGTIMADNVTAGLLVTTSYFSKDAAAFTEKVKHRMSLMDYNGLVKAISKTNP